MSENLRYYVGALYELGHVMRQVPADAWDDPSPCEGWSARDVAGHAMAVVATIRARLGLDPMIDPFSNVAEVAGADPLATFRRIRDDALAALDTAGALHTVLQTPAGETTIDRLLVPFGRDAIVHAWDIARATGVDERLDPDLVATTLALADSAPMARQPGRYGNAVDVADDADAQARLLALTGRTP